MKRINVRDKGNNYERYVSKLINIHFNLPEFTKRRGFETGKGRLKPPDIEFLDKDYKRFDTPNGGVECRKWKSWSFDKLTKNKHIIGDWIDEFLEKYGNADKFIIIFSKNNLDDFVLLNHSLIYPVECQITEEFILSFHYANEIWTILRFKDFLRLIIIDFFKGH